MDVGGTIVTAIAQQSFQYVREWDDAFLALFPHRYDYIWAKRPQPGEKPAWKTEKKHPLSDRMLRQGKDLYGVRSGQSTNYLLIDIDSDSPYHPQQDLQAIPRLLGALEPLELVTHIACTSSYSGGLHLYFPFKEAQNAYQLADAITTLLEHSGFKLEPGQLELFPNRKLYVTDGEPSLFAAHRLPLQEPGSYILNGAWESSYTDTSAFVQRWQFAQTRNTLTSATLVQVLQTRKRKFYKRLSKNAAKFLGDLDTEIEAGWTGSGQTNYLLGRLTLRAYIFHHVINGGSPLEGEALVKAVSTIAPALPGYADWCRHQHELDKKIAEWAKSVEASHYYHYGDQPEPKKSNAPGWNQQQQAAARTRITQAIADLLNQSNLPSGITARRNAIIPYGISHSTLTKHKDLWHPQFLAEPPVAPSLEALHPHAEVSNKPQPTKVASDGLLQPATTNKLVAPAASDAPQSASEGSFLSEVGGAGGISTGVGGFSAASTDSPLGVLSAPLYGSPSIVPGKDGTTLTSPVSMQQPVPELTPICSCASGTVIASDVATVLPPGVEGVQQTLLKVKAQQEALQTATRHARLQQQQLKAEAGRQRQLTRMQQFFTSGDPILVAEALAWAQVNPGILDTEQAGTSEQKPMVLH